jgi:hypothetical protein
VIDMACSKSCGMTDKKMEPTASSDLYDDSILPKTLVANESVDKNRNSQ